jgi:4'-phosphopantetheinyl transferase EntD
MSAESLPEVAQHGVQNPARMSVALARLFAAGVGTGELRESADPSLLYPEERWAARALDARRLATFAAGRLCARRALTGVGYSYFPLAANPDRAPRWPDSVVGSITHTIGFCGAIAASRHQFDAIGIDAQIIGNVTADLWPDVFTQPEIETLHARSIRTQNQFAAIALSAKEAFFRCRSASTRGLGFHDVSIELTFRETRSGIFSVQAVGREFAEQPLTGQFRVEGQLVVAGVAFARMPAAEPGVPVERPRTVSAR